MIGLWEEQAQGYLVATTAIALAFGLPILLAPFRWAAALGWRLPEERQLALYFARCLGAFLLILAALMLRAAVTGDDLVVTYQVILAVGALMVLVHVWGALQRVQPASETYEIALFAGLVLLTLLFYPG